MRVVIDEWIYTTLRKCRRKKARRPRAEEAESKAMSAAVVETPTTALERRESSSSSSSDGSDTSYTEELIIEERYETEQKLYENSPQEFLISSSTSSIELNTDQERVQVKIETDWRVHIRPVSPPRPVAEQEHYDNVTSAPGHELNAEVRAAVPATKSDTTRSNSEPSQPVDVVGGEARAPPGKRASLFNDGRLECIREVECDLEASLSSTSVAGSSPVRAETFPPVSQSACQEVQRGGEAFLMTPAAQTSPPTKVSLLAFCFT
jgi:hypothetical protein